MKKLLFIISSFLLMNCSSRIHHIRYNDKIMGYEGTAVKDSTSRRYRDKNLWIPIRNSKTKKKIIKKERAELIVDSLNSGYLEINQLTIQSKTSLYKEYESGTHYFQGIQSFKNMRYDHAKSSFIKALQCDPNLKYNSDIFYVLALCSKNFNDTIDFYNNYNIYLHYPGSQISFHLGTSIVGETPFRGGVRWAISCDRCCFPNYSS